MLKVIKINTTVLAIIWGLVFLLILPTIYLLNFKIYVSSLIIFGVSLFSTAFMINYSYKMNFVATIKERSQHKVPTPYSGGLAVIFSLLLGLGISNSFSPIDILNSKESIIFILLTIIIAIVSFLDDIHEISVRARLIIQSCLVAIAMLLFPEHKSGYLGLNLPYYLDIVVAYLGWVWFINLFNFMDGIDGLTGVATITVGFGLIIIACYWNNSALAQIGLILSVSILGFLVFNWHPAQIFIGDVGAITLGFFIGGILLYLASQGFFVFAVLIVAYHLGDASISLIRRILSGNKPWEPLLDRFFNRALLSGLSHSQVSLRIAICNIIILGLIIMSMYLNYDVNNLYVFLLGIGVVLATLLHFEFIYIKSNKNSTEKI